MELKDTIEMMKSNDYKERFKAEYYQVKIRHEKLLNMLIKYDAKTLDFKPSNIEILREQESAMDYYIYLLKVRAEIEDIQL